MKGASTRECIFCDIARGQEPASVIYKSDACMAFMDVHPISRGHALVIPIGHQARLGDIAGHERAELFEVANRVLEALRTCGLAKEGANLLLNDGAAANQHVAHVHLHVIPRARGDTPATMVRFLSRMLNVFGRRSERAALDTVAGEIRKYLEPAAY